MRREYFMQTRKAINHFLFWVALALLFNLGIYFYFGQQKAIEFFGGYIIEQSLSLDNLFLFLVIFSSFGITAEYQKRVLNYGIFGAIILRLIFVVLGVAIVNKFHWILYVFGVILIISGLKIMLKKEEEETDFKNNKLIKFLSKFIPFTDKLEGEKFFVRKNGVLYATPLLAILIIIESSDLIFAIDSIPAIFSITTDTFIVYSSNIFAILGLRNLYFLIEILNDKFKYVKMGVALILVFTGIKLSILFFHIEISVVYSVAIIFTILAASIIVSMIAANKETKGEKTNKVG
ncbi:MAG: TerC/Alx family metal homeostasis membrane protein [Clostridiaceae bacterium]